METETGKLFVGGISWDTDEDRLRGYFQTFGEIEEAVVMRDRATGRSRGFGFIVFADASVAEKVIKEKHIIDGRIVEAKRAVPRDDLQTPNRVNGTIQGSPGLAHTKKIFVGGLAPRVTESDFKKYFEHYGTVTDVVVMYDHNTQRPRGFGFITYDSEEAVDKVLVKTFHELNGKMVEVKRAVPKELSPGPTRSSSLGYAYGMNKAGSFLNAFVSNSSSGYGVRMDGRFSPGNAGRNGFPPYVPCNHTIESSLDSGLSLNYGPIGGDFGLGYGLGMNSYLGGNSSRRDSLIPFEVGSRGGNASILSIANRNPWGNQNPNFGTNSLTSSDFFSPGTSNVSGIGDGFGSIGEIWGLSPALGKVGGDGFGSGSLIHGNINFGQDVENIGGRVGYARNNGNIGRTSSYSFSNNVRDGAIGNFSLYDDHAWLSSSPKLEDFGSFGYGRGNVAMNVTPNKPVGSSRNHGIGTRSNPGIAA